MEHAIQDNGMMDVSSEIRAILESSQLPDNWFKDAPAPALILVI